MATPKKYVILKFMKDKRSWGFEKGDLEEIPLHWVIESIENGPATVWYPDPKQFSLEQTTKMKELGEDHPISQEAFDSNAFLKLSNVTVAADASTRVSALYKIKANQKGKPLTITTTDDENGPRWRNPSKRALDSAESQSSFKKSRNIETSEELESERGEDSNEETSVNAESSVSDEPENFRQDPVSTDTRREELGGGSIIPTDLHELVLEVLRELRNQKELKSNTKNSSCIPKLVHELAALNLRVEAIDKNVEKILRKMDKLPSQQSAPSANKDHEAYAKHFEALPLHSEATLKSFEEALVADPKLRAAFIKYLVANAEGGTKPTLVTASILRLALGTRFSGQLAATQSKSSKLPKIVLAHFAPTFLKCLKDAVHDYFDNGILTIPENIGGLVSMKLSQVVNTPSYKRLGEKDKTKTVRSEFPAEQSTLAQAAQQPLPKDSIPAPPQQHTPPVLPTPLIKVPASADFPDSNGELSDSGL